MKQIKVCLSLLLCLTLMLCPCSCAAKQIAEISSLSIENCERTTLKIGYTLQLVTNAPEEVADLLEWKASNSAAVVDSKGFVTAKEEGTVAITVSLGELKDTALIYVVSSDKEQGFVYPEFTDREDEQTASSSSSSPTLSPSSSSSQAVTIPTQPEAEETLKVDKEARAAFYGNSDPADSHAEAVARSKQGLISGAEKVPDQAPTLSQIMPKKNGVYIRNNEPIYLDSNTYVVVNSEGEEVFRVYRGGGYITLEEVAAYLYAFGDVPANYIEGKNKDPEGSIWGKYLRLNHSKFSGNTTKYPYEPELPDISGCGGELYYYEVDIGTTGTDCDPHYSVRTYNDGKDITRGAARIVYTRFDKNGNSIIDPNEKFLFYTYNHYNDFQEYLNYYGGWGSMFGNITGGGQLSSKKNYNPTPYIPSVLGKLPKVVAPLSIIPFCEKFKLFAA